MDISDSNNLRGKLLEVDSYQIGVKGWGLTGGTPKAGALAFLGTNISHLFYPYLTD